MDKILKYLVFLAYVAASEPCLASEVTAIDARSQSSQFDTVLSATIEYMGRPESDQSLGRAVLFGLRELERVAIERGHYLGLSGREREKLVRIMIFNKSPREVAVAGCLMSLSEVQNFAPDGDSASISKHFAAGSVAEVHERRQRALDALKVLLDEASVGKIRQDP